MADDDSSGCDEEAIETSREPREASGRHSIGDRIDRGPGSGQPGQAKLVLNLRSKYRYLAHTQIYAQTQVLVHDSLHESDTAMS